MTRSAVFVACVGAFCLGISSTASADPVDSFDVILTGGFMRIDLTDFPPGGSVSLEANPRFGLSGFAGSTDNFFEPVQGCLVCAPGDQIGTSASISTWAFGNAVADGRSFTLGPNGAPDVDGGAHITIEGGPIAVPAFRPSPVVVTGGSVIVFDSAFADIAHQSVFVGISGAGRVSMTFAPVSTGEHLWDLREVRYDFGPTPTATPEPATLTLVTGALILSALRARTQRRNQRTDIQLSTSTPTA